MPENYYLRYKDKIIGVFYISGERIYYRPNQQAADTIPNSLGYPLGLFPLDRSKKGMTPVKDYIPVEEDIKLWLSDRVFPPDREGAYNLLNAMGLYSYDMWEIAKRTKAVSFNDHYWMSINPEDKYEEIHPRFLQDSSEQSSGKDRKKVNPSSVGLRKNKWLRRRGKGPLLHGKVNNAERNKKSMIESIYYEKEEENFFPKNELIKV